ncbi:MAG: fasciclin domain-containing protein [Ilumatobacteraceae bacterium]
MRKHTPIVALLAAGSLLFAACGEDGESADTTAAPASSAADTTAPATEEGDIIAVATAAGSFNTLAAALSAAGLVETLQGEGPFTVFAPTDEAFAALPAGLVDALLLPENIEILKDILLFHVISGSEVTSDMVAAGDVTMASGDAATIVVDGSTITIAGAPISAVDVQASNGVIHVIDAVMVPADVDVTALLG